MRGIAVQIGTRTCLSGGRLKSQVLRLLSLPCLWFSPSCRQIVGFVTHWVGSWLIVKEQFWFFVRSKLTLAPGDLVPFQVMAKTIGYRGECPTYQPSRHQQG